MVDYLGPNLYPDVLVRANIFGFSLPKVAAGADARMTVPFGVVWQVVSFGGVFTASAAAANRQVGFIVRTTEPTTVYQYNMTAAVTANLSGTFWFSEDCSAVPTAFATGNSLLMPQPSAWFPAGWTFGTSTLNIDVGDQWSSVAVWVQEWLPPPGE